MYKITILENTIASVKASVDNGEKVKNYLKTLKWE